MNDENNPLIQNESQEDSHVRMEPKWQALKKVILADIQSGKYRPGDVIPSENYYARKLKIARNTIRQALMELEKLGLVERKQGRGTFVCEAPGERTVPVHDFGLILPAIRGDLYSSLVQGFAHGAGLSQNQILTSDSFNNVDQQGNIILQMIDKQMSGIAMVPVIPHTTPAYQVRQLQTNRIPLVFCHRRVEGISAPLLTWNWKEAGRMAGNLLLEKGHRAIGYFGSYRYSISEGYEEGLRESLEAQGLELREGRIHYGAMVLDDANRFADEQEKRAALQTMMEGEDAVTAIFCSGDTEGEIMYHLAMDLGIQVPAELSIIGFGENVRDTIIRRRLTSITINELQLGQQAAVLLQAMREGKAPLYSDTRIDFPLSLSNGQTVVSPRRK